MTKKKPMEKLMLWRLDLLTFVALCSGVSCGHHNDDLLLIHNSSISTYQKLSAEQTIKKSEFPHYSSFEPHAQQELFKWIDASISRELVEPSKNRIPIFVITCDRLTVLIKTLLSFYKSIKTPFEIVIQDNHSTYPPTLDFLRHLQSMGITVNFGDKDVVQDIGLNAVSNTVAKWYESHDSDVYVVTDPDIELDEGPGDILTILSTLLLDSPRINVVGPMLHRDDIPDFYPFRALAQDQNWFKFTRWEGEWNGNPSTIQDGYIDTVFGMYRKSFRFHNYNYALQTCRPYMARHLDWYIDPYKLAPDQVYYWHKKSPVGHWSSTLLKEIGAADP